MKPGPCPRPLLGPATSSVRTPTEDLIDGVTGPGLAVRLGVGLRVPGPRAAQHPGDGGHAGRRLLVTEPLADQPLPDLPAEDAGVVPLVLLDLALHLGRGHARLAAADHPGPDASGLLVPGGNCVLYQHIV